MTHDDPHHITTTQSLAVLLLENLDRADSPGMAQAAAIIDHAAHAPGLDTATAHRWGRAVALYHSALLGLTAPDVTAEPPEDYAPPTRTPRIYFEP